MTQLLMHLWGDYIFQSDWMAKGKTIWWLPCAVHVLFYSAGFLLLRPSWQAFAVIAGTHYLIDRYRLARFVVHAKNWMPAHWMLAGAPIIWNHRVTPTGYPDGTPDFLAVWLLIIADNILHLTINFGHLYTCHTYANSSILFPCQGLTKTAWPQVLQRESSSTCRAEGGATC